MRIIYIAHCIGVSPGIYKRTDRQKRMEIQRNLKDLYRIIRRINLEYPDIVPFAPYIADILSLDDNVPEERERGIKNDVRLIEAGFINECWLTGPKISGGMQLEALKFKMAGIPVVDQIGLL